MTLKYIKPALGDPDNSRETRRGLALYWQLLPDVRLSCYKKSWGTCSLQKQGEVGAYSTHVELDLRHETGTLSEKNYPSEEDYLNAMELGEKKRGEYNNGIETYLDVIRNTWPSSYWDMSYRGPPNPKFNYIPPGQWEFNQFSSKLDAFTFESPLLKMSVEVYVEKNYANIRDRNGIYKCYGTQELRQELKRIKCKFIQDLKKTHDDLHEMLGVEK